MNIRKSLLQLFCFGVLCCPLSAQVPVADLQAVAGPWECVDSNGIHGIFLSSDTQLKGSGREQKVDWQHQDIYVSRRLVGGKTQGGYFVPNRTDATSTTDFDGKRLTIHFANNKLPN